MLPETDSKGAQRIAAQAIEAVRALSIAHPDAPSGRVSISVGVGSTIPNPKLTPTRLFAAADEALYAAKHAGRDGLRSAEIVGARELGQSRIRQRGPLLQQKSRRTHGFMPHQYRQPHNFEDSKLTQLELNLPLCHHLLAGWLKAPTLYASNRFKIKYPTWF